MLFGGGAFIGNNLPFLYGEPTSLWSQHYKCFFNQRLSLSVGLFIEVTRKI